MHEGRTCRLGIGERVTCSLHIDGAQNLFRRIKFQAGGAMDQQIMRSGSEAHEWRGDIAAGYLKLFDKRAIIAAHVGRAANQRGNAVPLRDKPRTNFAADQSGGSGHQNLQQQGGSLLPGLASDCPKGTAVPQPGNTP